jgi:hypothetical protein
MDLERGEDGLQLEQELQVMRADVARWSLRYTIVGCVVGFAAGLAASRVVGDALQRSDMGRQPPWHAGMFWPWVSYIEMWLAAFIAPIVIGTALGARWGSSRAARAERAAASSCRPGGIFEAQDVVRALRDVDRVVRERGVAGTLTGLERADLDAARMLVRQRGAILWELASASKAQRRADLIAGVPPSQEPVTIEDVLGKWQDRGFIVCVAAAR